MYIFYNERCTRQKFRKYDDVVPNSTYRIIYWTYLFIKKIKTQIAL